MTPSLTGDGYRILYPVYCIESDSLIICFPLVQTTHLKSYLRCSVIQNVLDVVKFPSSFLWHNDLLLCSCFASGHFYFLCVFPTDSDPDCSTDSQGGPSGLPQAVARAHPHSARVREGSGWPAAAQSAANLLSCHQNLSVQTPGTGQTAFPGCKSTVLAISQLFRHHSQFNIFIFFYLIACHSLAFCPLHLMQ